jgi:5-methylcytosine-specific restriction endonuclease McrA
MDAERQYGREGMRSMRQRWADWDAIAPPPAAPPPAKVRSRSNKATRSRKAKDRRARKRRLADQQDHRCAGCRERFDLDDLTFDHIVPVAHGGTNRLSNLQLMCRPCNQDKADSLPA